MSPFVVLLSLVMLAGALLFVAVIARGQHGMGRGQNGRSQAVRVHHPGDGRTRRQVREANWATVKLVAGFVASVVGVILAFAVFISMLLLGG